MGPSPLVDFFRRGEAARDVRLLAAQGVFAPRALDQLAILVLLVDDPDPEIQRTAEATLERIPQAILAAFLGRSDVPTTMREFFAARGVVPAGPQTGGAVDTEDPLIETPDASDADDLLIGGENEDRSQSIVQKLATMGFSQKLKAAVKGPREMRAILVRDPNRTIAVAVMSSPKLTEQEIETFARMANVSEDVLRIIGSNRAWMKNYGVVVGLTKNPKTPLAMSLNLMNRLNNRDLSMLSIDRNVPEPLRIAARKRVVVNR